MFLGELIKDYRLRHKMSMQEFADLAGLSKPYISQLEKNRNPKTGDVIVPSPDTFQKVAHAMGISFDDLVRTVDENQPMALTSMKQNVEPSNILRPAARAVPILGTICAGDGIVAEQCYSGQFFIDSTIQADYCLKVQGDSMVGAEIYDGDYAFLKKATEFRSGQIYAVLLAGTNEATLKKVYRQGDQTLILSPCNDGYDPIVTDTVDCLLVGELTGVYHHREDLSAH